MTLQKRRITFVIIAIVLISCSTQSQDVFPTNELSPTVRTTEYYHSPSPSETVYSDEFPTPAVTNVTSSVTPEHIRELLSSSCLSISSKPPKEKIPWNLLLAHSKTLYLYDINKQDRLEVSLIEADAAIGYYVSPDGKWLAYQDGANTNTYVESTQNFIEKGTHKQIKWGNYPHLLTGWVSNDRLMISRKPSPTTFLSTVILNPFSGELHEYFLEDYPNYKYFKANGIGAFMFGHSNLMPDPDLTRIVYPEVIDDQAYITLWDIEKKVAIGKLKGFYEDIYNDPLWASDGSDFLILNLGSTYNLEWFQVSKNGLVEQITDFNNILDSLPHFSSASRSRNGDYFTFRIEYMLDDKTSAKYLVLNLRSNPSKGICINSIPMRGSEFHSPVWSPDSRYLAISNTKDNTVGDLILVDMLSAKAYLVGKDVYAIGWIQKLDTSLR